MLVDVLDELTPLLLLRVEVSLPVMTRVRELLVVAWLRVDEVRPEVTASLLLLELRDEELLVPTWLPLDRVDEELLTPASFRDELLLEPDRFRLLSLDEAREVA